MRQTATYPHIDAALKVAARQRVSRERAARRLIRRALPALSRAIDGIGQAARAAQISFAEFGAMLDTMTTPQEEGEA